MALNRYDPAIPEGFRQLLDGEEIRVGDIYWSDPKWYSVSPTNRCGKYDISYHTRFCRRLDGLTVRDEQGRMRA